MKLNLDPDYPTHLNTQKLQRLLKINNNEAVGILFKFWMGAMDNADAYTGSLEKIDATDIAIWSGYDGKPQDLLTALKQCEFVTINNAVNNWGKYEGATIYQRIKNSERMRKNRMAARYADMDGID